MKRQIRQLTTMLIWIGVISFSGIIVHIFARQTEWNYHTTPDKWKEPRLFHTPFEPECENRIAISHEELTVISEVKVFSPNKAYWFGINPEEGYELVSSHADGIRFHVFSPDVPIYVFNERDQLVKILLKDHYPNFVVDVRWINEKLLYIQVWWGRILGSYLILDVEKESVVYREMVNDGNLPFMQWQQAKQE